MNKQTEKHKFQLGIELMVSIGLHDKYWNYLAIEAVFTHRFLLWIIS